MSKNPLLVSALLGFAVVLFGGPSVLAQEAPVEVSPVQIAKHCIYKVTELANQCVRLDKKHTARAVQNIEQLLEDGQPEKARKLAERTIHSINVRTQKCVESIREICRNHVRAIIEAGGSPELVEHVRAVCHRQVEKVQNARKISVAKIKEALGVVPQDPPEA